MKVMYRVSGMTCGGCSGAVSSALKRAGVEAQVDHGTGLVTVDALTDPAVIERAVTSAGFDYEGPASAQAPAQ